jgi:predicted ArsR family transcriptional regulator
VPFSLFELVADPVRLAIMRELSGTGSVPLTEIAEQAGLHANTVRTHMGELEASGAVVREHATADGPGRPQVRYRLRPGWRLPSSDLQGLSELLAALVARIDPSIETVQELGRHWGRFLSGRPGGDPVKALPRLLERLGFDAEVRGLEVTLSSCPCAAVAPEHPELICHLAVAAIDGIAETSPRGLRVSSSSHDPKCRTCTVMLAARAAAR